MDKQEMLDRLAIARRIVEEMPDDTVFTTVVLTGWSGTVDISTLNNAISFSSYASGRDTVENSCDWVFRSFEPMDGVRVFNYTREVTD